MGCPIARHSLICDVKDKGCSPFVCFSSVSSGTCRRPLFPLSLSIAQLSTSPVARVALAVPIAHPISHGSLNKRPSETRRFSSSHFHCNISKSRHFPDIITRTPFLQPTHPMTTCWLRLWCRSINSRVNLVLPSFVQRSRSRHRQTDIDRAPQSTTPSHLPTKARYTNAAM